MSADQPEGRITTSRETARTVVRLLTRSGGPLALLVLALLAAVMATPATAGAAAVAGTGTITKPGQLAVLNSGGSGTLYGVALPSGASCPGDTAHDGYHVFSYLVPEGVSPASVDFKTGQASKFFGYIAYGEYYGAVNTAEGTGQIGALPSQFTWARLTPKDLFPNGEKSATWEGGIACANTHGVVTDYWNSQIVFAASTSDPKGFTWKVVDQPSLAPSHKWVWIGVALIVLSVALAALAVFLSRRRDPPSGGPSPESGGASPLSGEPGHSPATDRPAPEPSAAGR